MKIMVASDIHGSAYYCEKLVEAYKYSGTERLLLLGDILYHGPHNDLPVDYDPKKVIKMLNRISKEIICIKGNCDSEVDDSVLDFNIMADYAILFENRRMIFATHGHEYNEKKLPTLKEGDIFLYGHTHVPVCTSLGRINIMNPGSVSIPREDSWHGYMTIDNGLYKWYDFDGTVRMSVE